MKSAKTLLKKIMRILSSWKAIRPICRTLKNAIESWITCPYISKIDVISPFFQGFIFAKLCIQEDSRDKFWIYYSPYRLQEANHSFVKWWRGYSLSSDPAFWGSTELVLQSNSYSAAASDTVGQVTWADVDGNGHKELFIPSYSTSEVFVFTFQ